MNAEKIVLWAKTLSDNRPGISVRDHCLNVGCVAEALIDVLLPAVRGLIPQGAATLAALHDVGKITIGFQAKCPRWLAQEGLPKFPPGEVTLSVTDHALVSQCFLQKIPDFMPARLWAVAVGAHHGRPKGKIARLNAPEALKEWAEENRLRVMEEIRAVFGPLPTTPPEAHLAPYHSDLWLLAGLISIAVWIGSNEAWFSPEYGLQPDAARTRIQAREVLREIGWPGGRLRQTGFSAAFATEPESALQANPLQKVVADVSKTPGVLIIEGPMGCGKTEAALFAAQQLIASGQQQGMYFALPTQVTSNRIHKRIERFLGNTLADDASLRLVHGNAWLEDNFDLRLRPAFQSSKPEEQEEVFDQLREARSWFASAKQALLAPYGVGTIDQALQAVVAVKHFFVRRFALAGKVVILDEVHSYDMYTGTLITALLRELVNLRSSVIILSATLTAARRRELLAAAGISESNAPTAYPLVTSGTTDGECRHSSPEWSSHRRISLNVAVISEEETRNELIARAEAGQSVLWIRNTVVEAQQAFRDVSSSVREGAVRVGLLHSRFPFQRRADLEEDWLEHLGPNRSASALGSILVATQVVEQSVDIDLDFIVSDLAPSDMLLQRLGRLWRHKRPNRPAIAPYFWIRLPELPTTLNAMQLKKALGRSARVYAPYVLLRTAAVWSGRKELLLPADIRPLLEATYVELDLHEPEAWRELHAGLEQEKAILAANAAAATRVLGLPMLQDEDDALTRRRGAPTKPVVLLRCVTTGSPGSVIVVGLDHSQAEISEHEWRKASARFIHHSLVRTPRWMVPINSPRPHWLTLHGPSGVTVAIVRDDGRCVFGDEVSTMRYDPYLGIFAESTTQLTPQRDDDDEFDY
jgi:CRISPR-associated endonuclease/helicase Cas3